MAASSGAERLHVARTAQRDPGRDGLGGHSSLLAFTQVLEDGGIRVSMDGRSWWTDNVFIERLWRSLKYECLSLHAFETGLALHTGLLQ